MFEGRMGVLRIVRYGVALACLSHRHSTIIHVYISYYGSLSPAAFCPCVLLFAMMMNDIKLCNENKLCCCYLYKYFLLLFRLTACRLKDRVAHFAVVQNDFLSDKDNRARYAFIYYLLLYQK